MRNLTLRLAARNEKYLGSRRSSSTVAHFGVPGCGCHSVVDILRPLRHCHDLANNIQHGRRPILWRGDSDQHRFVVRAKTVCRSKRPHRANEYLCVSRALSNRFLTHATHTHATDQHVEWPYAFDVHANSFFPLFLQLYVAQLLLAPVVTRHNWVCLWVGNTLYLSAVSAENARERSPAHALPCGCSLRNTSM